MKKLVVVETQEEYDKWYAQQKAFYASNPDKGCIAELMPAPEAEAPATPPEPSNEEKLLTEIRDLLKK